MDLVFYQLAALLIELDHMDQLGNELLFKVRLSAYSNAVCGN